MPIIVKGTGWSIGAVIALLTLIACFVFLIVGGATPFALLIMIGALALAYLIG